MKCDERIECLLRFALLRSETEDDIWSFANSGITNPTPNEAIRGFAIT